MPQIMGEVKEIKIGFLNGKIKRAQVRDLREVYIYIYIYMERERERLPLCFMKKNHMETWPKCVLILWWRLRRT